MSPAKTRRVRIVGATTSALLALLALPAAPLHSQESSRDWVERCSEQRRGNGRVTHCEIREATIAAPARLEVSARPNGGIDVTGSGRSDVHVVARVQAWGDSDAEAREIAQQVEVQTSSGRISADGPRRSDGQGWAVSFVVSTPRSIDLELGTVNGGLSVNDVSGDLSLTTTNGGISMAGVGGRVLARTTNGGVDVRLAGDRWSGEGLELHTTNGGIDLSVPDGFSANLRASTVHGGIDTDFPVTVQGRIGRSIDAQIGGGGPPVRLSTTNGGIDIRRN
jgi:DUF4097 and DUF4098 domain-containing protein YvlB